MTKRKVGSLGSKASECAQKIAGEGGAKEDSLWVNTNTRFGSAANSRYGASNERCNPGPIQSGSGWRYWPWKPNKQEQASRFQIPEIPPTFIYDLIMDLTSLNSLLLVYLLEDPGFREHSTGCLSFAGKLTLAHC